jgi:hypothetical protein
MPDTITADVHAVGVTDARVKPSKSALHASSLAA